MLIRLFIATAIVLALVIIIRWFNRAPAPIVARRLRRLALYGVIGLLIFLAVSGKLHWLFAAAAALFPLLLRMLPLLRYVPFLRQWYQRYQTRHTATAGPASGAPGSQQSTVVTHFLRMTLDHQRGEIDGLILAGRFINSRLSELTLAQLVQLNQDYLHQDADSARLLQRFAERIHGEAWHTAQQQASSPSAHTTTMSRAEAYEILDLAAGATRDEIIAAHRRLMQKVHPDHGGSTYLAARINQAKDLLLKS